MRKFRSLSMCEARDWTAPFLIIDGAKATVKIWKVFMTVA